MIHAKRTLGGKTIKRTFTKIAWDLMGKDKGGWSIDPKEMKKGQPVEKPIELEKVEEVVEEVVEEKVEEEVVEEEETEVETEASEESKSTIENITVADVIVVLKTLNTVEDVKAYIGDDPRSGVEKAAAKRISQIEEA